MEGTPATTTNPAKGGRPTPVEVVFTDGTKQRITLPVETWLTTGTHTWTLDNKTPIASVTADPDHKLPDDNRSNNVKRM